METFLFSGVFWGIVVILWGISIILNAVFQVHIPIFRILVAIFFVYLGIMILTGGFRVGKADRNTVIFGEGEMNSQSGDKSREFSVIFGKATTVITPGQADANAKFKVNAIFGEHVVVLDPKTPARIRANSAFGSVVLPDGSATTFGNNAYESASYKNAKNAVEIEANAVFGALRVTAPEAKKQEKK